MGFAIERHPKRKLTHTAQRDRAIVFRLTGKETILVRGTIDNSAVSELLATMHVRCDGIVTDGLDIALEHIFHDILVCLFLFS